MYNPDAHSDCMRQMGRRDASEPVIHDEGVCPPCANREHDCWHGDCACQVCNPKVEQEELTPQETAALYGESEEEKAEVERE